MIDRHNTITALKITEIENATDDNQLKMDTEETNRVAFAKMKATLLLPIRETLRNAHYVVPDNKTDDKNYRTLATELQFTQYRLLSQLLLTLNVYEAAFMKDPKSSSLPINDILHILPYLPFIATENDPNKMPERLILCELSLLDIALGHIDQIIKNELIKINEKNDPSDNPRKELLARYRKHFSDEKIKVINLISRPENITSNSDARPDKIRSNLQFYINNMMSEKVVVNNASYFSRIINSLVSVINHITPFKFEKPFKTLSSEIRSTITPQLFTATTPARQFSYSEFIKNNPQEPYPRSVFVANFLSHHPTA